MMIANPQTERDAVEMEFIEDEETIRLIVRREGLTDTVFHLDADDDRWLLTLDADRRWNDKLLTSTNGDFQ
jgi:hypothetical protein